jgi:hypothetical protein
MEKIAKEVWTYYYHICISSYLKDNGKCAQFEKPRKETKP